MLSGKKFEQTSLRLVTIEELRGCTWIFLQICIITTHELLITIPCCEVVLRGEYSHGQVLLVEFCSFTN
jgi:hypothetical protein